MFKLGKLPARPDAVKFSFSDYVTTKLPTPPKTFGHETLVSDFGMLGNDTVGDCVLAGGGHETMLWNKAAHRDVPFSTANTIGDYSAITGYDPKDPNTDQGTDMELAAKYRRTTGLADANGSRHKIGAYLKLTPGNLNEHLLAAYLFGAVGIGIKFPGSAMDQFNAGKPWSVVKASTIEGGHYIPFVAHRKNIVVVTWGKCQQMTSGFFKKYNDESLVYISEEFLTNGKSPEGFDMAALQADLAALKSVK